nr:4Fe-4S binding protein [Candidatus Sigynarchaeota archaeon]
MMFKMLKNGVLKKGIITTRYPKVAIEQSLRCKGMPFVDMTKCTKCEDCATACPVNAITVTDTVVVDLGLCIFCGACERVCAQDAMKLSREIELASKNREDLKVKY